jgi:hypothetical protein
VSSDEEMHSLLLAIYSRVGSVEGKVNLVARANRPGLLAELEETVSKTPLIGQIYLLLDGKRSQQDVLAALTAAGITTSQPTVSRRMGEMETDHGIADVVKPGTYRRDPQMEQILNLSTKFKKWLSSAVR